MSIPMTPTRILVIGLSMLVGFGVSGALVSRDNARQKKYLKRRDDILVPYAPTHALDIRLFTRPSAKDRPWREKIASLFGLDLERPDICPVPWWIVIGIAAVISEIMTTSVVALMGRIGWPAFPVLWVLLSRAVFLYFRGKRRTKLLEQFPDALMMIVRSVRVGVPVGEAMHIVAHELPQPTAGEFNLLANKLAVGEPLDQAIMFMAAHADLPDYRFFAIALSLQSKAGGALSGTLEGLAELIRKRIAVRQRAYALASEARTSIYVLTGMPIMVGGALAMMNPDYIDLLVTDPLGKKLLTAAILLVLTGLGTMQVIVKKSVT